MRGERRGKEGKKGKEEERTGEDRGHKTSRQGAARCAWRAHEWRRVCLYVRGCCAYKGKCARVRMCACACLRSHTHGALSA